LRRQDDLMAVFAKTDLYVVITEAFCAGRTALEVLAKALEAGVRLVQMREKDMDGRRLYLRKESQFLLEKREPRTF
jgi:thiamine monophosphate synthase